MTDIATAVVARLAASCCCNGNDGRSWHTTHISILRWKLFFYQSAGGLKTKKLYIPRPQVLSTSKCMRDILLRAKETPTTVTIVGNVACHVAFCCVVERMIQLQRHIYTDTGYPASNCRPPPPPSALTAAACGGCRFRFGIWSAVRVPGGHD